MDVYSHAFNFGSYFKGAVDPRSGQYSVRINLMTLCPMGPLEVSRNIALSFSMLSADSSVYGTGWRLSNTEFDSARLRLTLLSGEQFKAQSMPIVGGTLVFKDRKLKDLVVRRPDANTLHVVYKDGTVEVLQRTDSSMPYRIVAIEFENGERLKWEYTRGGSLERVLGHDQQVLLLLTYSSGQLAMVDSRVDGGRYARTRFTYSNGRLTAVTAPYDRDGALQSAGYVFGYTPAFSNGLIGINQVKSPVGGEEFIRYIEKGHQYGNGQYLPRVFSWVQTPASSQEPITRTYTYSTGSNFTGFPYSGGFREGEDNLYLIGGDYSYWAEEQYIDPLNYTVLSSTRSTYNRFHLLTEERKLREGTLTTTNVTYNIKPGLFAEQPANFQLPHTITKSYELVAGGTARQDVVTVETDEFANVLSRTESSGVITEYDYYPVAGEAGLCPAEPHGLFTRFVKQERMIPVGGVPAARLTDYTYTAVPAPGGSHFVLESTSAQAGRVSAQKTYQSTPGNLSLHGRLLTDTSTLGGHTLVTEFSYEQHGDALSETRRLHGREGQWLDSVSVISLTNRRQLSMCGEGGVTLAVQFDVAGRLTTETAAPGKPERAERRYVYQFATPTRRANLVATDAQGRSIVTYFDGAGRPVAEALLLDGDSRQEQPLGSWRYDALGQRVEEVRVDYLPEGERFLTATYAYNAWGNASRVSRADGSVQIDEYDPRLHRRVTGVEGGERLETYFNEHHQPVLVNRVDTLGQETQVESRTYDGLGRCLSRLDIGNNCTEYFYDLFDRVVRTLETPADGSPAREKIMVYAPGTSEQLVQSISVDGKQVGSRTYDSLGRLTLQSRGTAPATTWQYEPNWTEPVAIVSGAGHCQQWSYEKELGVPAGVKMAGHADNQYRYDPVSAALKSSENGALKHELFHDLNGYLQKEVQTVTGTPMTTHYGYSLGGRLLHHTADDGLRSAFEYDDQGRFCKMVAGPVLVEQRYDALARPDVLTTRYDSTQLVTQVTYDTLGREAERRFEQNGVLLHIMTSTYHPDSLLASRTLRDANAQMVTCETFTYDAFSRLTTYRCEGREHPQDHLGRDIVEQRFRFDSLDNITRVMTVFAGGTRDTSERFFTAADPTRLTRLTHTNPPKNYDLTYDDAGNVRGGPLGQIYTYNGFDQLTHVQAGAQEYSYQYDAQFRQVVAARGDETPVALAYTDGRLDTLVEGARTLRYVNAGGQVLARTGGVEGPQLHGSDAAGSVRGISTPGQAQVRRHYAPYGDGHVVPDDGKVRSMADLQLPAFNGERLDAAVGLYHLGNGRRAYDPRLMVFLSADPLAPFEEGGINSYAYCAGNPINLMDPSGLWPTWLKWALTGVALALSVAALGFATAGLAGALAAGITGLAMTAKVLAVVATSASTIGGTLGIAGLGVEAVDQQMGWDRSQHIKNLGWASFGFSTVGVVAAVGVSVTAGAMAVKNAVAQANTALSFPERFYVGATAAVRNALGSTYKFGDQSKITTLSQTFGGTRSVLRWTNFGRGIESRIKSQQPGAAPEADPVEASASQQPQPQPMDQGLVDMLGSSAYFYRAFRREAMRIRQPILSQLARQA